MMTANTLRAVARRQVDEARAEVEIARVKCAGGARYNNRYGNWFLHQHEGHLQALEATATAPDEAVAPVLRALNGK